MSNDAERPSGRTPVTATLDALNEASAAFQPISGRPFNVTITGSGPLVGTLTLQRSLDDGVTWHDCTDNGTPIAFTASASEVVSEYEHGVDYRLKMTAYTSGSAVVRLSQ
jgi:hypothetical protein